MDIDLIKQVLIVAISSSVISTSLTQKIKEGFKFKKSKTIVLVSFVVSVLVGTFFSLSFTELSLINSLWVGLVSFIGADAIYKTFEDKIFKSFSDLDNRKKIVIDRKDDNV